MRSNYLISSLLLLTILFLMSCGKESLKEMDSYAETAITEFNTEETTATIDLEVATDSMQVAASSRSGCNNKVWFHTPTTGSSYKGGKDVYVKVKADNPHHIEYIKLYVDGEYVRKENSSPYEWGKPRSNSDDLLNNMHPGSYKLKIEIKDKCGKYTYEYCTIHIKDYDCHYKAWFHKADKEYYEEGEDLYVKMEVDNADYIEYMELYVNDEKVRKEESAPYEWGKPRSDHDDALNHLKPGTYELKVKIKDKCGEYDYKYCKIYVKDKNCEYKVWFEKEDKEYYEAGEDLYVEVKTDYPDYIEYMELYVNDRIVRKEGNAPYEWGKPRTDSDYALNDLKPGTYELKVKIKDKCGHYTYKYCKIYVKDKYNHCDYKAWFYKPVHKDHYRKGEDIYVKVKTDNDHDIEYMKLYVNDRFVRKEENAPYEWGIPNGSGDYYLRDMKRGTYKITVKIKDKCGDYRYGHTTIYVD